MDLILTDDEQIVLEYILKGKGKRRNYCGGHLSYEFGHGGSKSSYYVGILRSISTKLPFLKPFETDSDPRYRIDLPLLFDMWICATRMHVDAAQPAEPTYIELMEYAGWI